MDAPTDSQILASMTRVRPEIASAIRNSITRLTEDQIAMILTDQGGGDEAEYYIRRAYHAAVDESRNYT